jgi:hypothetical protein
MTIDRIFSGFRTHGTPLAKVIRGFFLHAARAGVVCASWIAMQPDQAQAAQVTQGNPGDASWNFVVQCEKMGVPARKCTKQGMLIDPTDPSVSNLTLALTFDSTLYTFDAAASGTLCNFAADRTPCPPLAAKIGTFLVPEDDTPPGSPPEGASLTFSVSPGNCIAGPALAASAASDVVSCLIVNFHSSTPIDLTNDQNVLELVFDLVNPVPADIPLIATYFETPGNHQFNQVSFFCDTPCSGIPPVPGVDVAVGVPEPASATILGIALAVFGISGGIVLRRHPMSLAGDISRRAA